jgi:tRNA nucleotidyltransferase (CCA-adding enzyme)
MNDKKIKEIAETVKNNNGNLYLVGGAVRDMYLNKEPHDKDYCVTGLSETQFLNLFPEAKVQGKAFAVFIIDNTEFALARTEVKTGNKHNDFIVDVGSNISIEEDLGRRDITINAMAIDVLQGNLIDPFNGLKDIENKTIRKTTDAFLEDPLRVYRVCRFASELDFTVEMSTIKAMNSLKDELKYLSSERVFVEFRKALNTTKPSVFFDYLKKADLLSIHFIEINDLIGAKQPVEYHPEGDSYQHTMEVIDRSAKLTDDIEIRFACLVHDLGKGLTPKDKYPQHIGHDKFGVKPLRDLVKRLKMPTRWYKVGKTACLEHMRAGIFDEMSVGKKVQFIEKVSKSMLGLEGLKIVMLADKKADKVESDFVEIGKEIMTRFDGNYIIEKYQISDYTKIPALQHKERVSWLKHYLKQEVTNSK